MKNPQWSRKIENGGKCTAKAKIIQLKYRRETTPTYIRLRNCGIREAELVRFVFENNQQQHDDISNQFRYLF